MWNQTIVLIIAALGFAGCGPVIRTEYVVEKVAPTASPAPVETLTNPAAVTDVLTSKEILDQSGKKVTGTMPLGGNVTGAEGLESFLLPLGYYDGARTANATDADLVAGNITSGVTIFGVTGTALLETHSACTSSGQTGCVTNASFLAGAPKVSISGGNGSKDISIPQGYYDGTKTATASDTNLLAANVRNGINLFGTTGSLTPAYTACTDNALNAGQCSTAANRYVTATAGAAVNASNGALSATIPQGFYSGAQSCSMSDTDLLAANIKNAVTIFGVTGSAPSPYSACTDNALNAGQCSTAAGRYVTSSAGGAVTGADGSLSATIPKGFYDGTTSATMSDTDLVAGNIASAVTIFGVTGNLAACTGANQSGCLTNPTYPSQSTPASPAGVADVLSGKEFYAGGALQTGTMSNRGNWNMETTAFPGAGYYSGLTSTLAPATVCSTKSIFGSAGTAVCQTGSTANPAGAANILSGLEAWNSTGTKITGTMANRGALDASVALPGAGYYNGTVNNAPGASQICSGATVLGASGSASCGASAASDAYRDTATAQITQTQETTTYAGADLPAQYRDIPKISKDDDGYTGASVTRATRPAVDCGTTQATIALRIADCLAQNPTAATWDGTVNGNAGQSVWKLVARNGADTEVWRDEATGLLWTTPISTTVNWCHATGSSNASGVAAAYREADAAGTCNNAANQNQTNPISVCFEETGFATTYVDAPAKGGLKAASTPPVRWRLPTMADYKVAEAHGIRLVFPASAASHWSATVYSGVLSQAWSLTWNTASVAATARTALNAARCIGRGQ